MGQWLYKNRLSHRMLLPCRLKLGSQNLNCLIKHHHQCSISKWATAYFSSSNRCSQYLWTALGWKSISTPYWSTWCYGLLVSNESKLLLVKPIVLFSSRFQAILLWNIQGTLSCPFSHSNMKSVHSLWRAEAFRIGVYRRCIWADLHSIHTRLRMK